MSLHWYDFVGTSGVIIILVAYFMLQSERMASRDLSYSLLNLIGSLLITVSLLYAFNLPSFIIEMAWISISIYGIYRHFDRRQQKTRNISN